jgi:conjugal transfer pilus assembly protein TraD
MRWRGLAWTCGLAAVLGLPVALLIGWRATTAYGAAAVVVVVAGAGWHYRDVMAGGDLSARARNRRGPADRVRTRFVRHRIRRGRWIDDEGVVVGQDSQGRLVRVPICGSSPSHGLACGATGSGKTVSMVLIAQAAIARGFGVIVIDPKPDDFMFEHLRDATRRAGRRFILWTPEGDTIYNPYGHGFDTEIADKLLATETFTEPHYERLAQRYLGHAVRALRAAGVTVSLATVLEVMRPAALASLARDVPPETVVALLDYLESLTPQQERDLAGARDRLAILAETDMARWLDPRSYGEAIDLRAALDRGDVVMFRLDADRRPLATGMLAAAIVQDLVAISAGRQSGDHRPGLIVIDEFSAIAAKEVVRLFGRARGANLSLLLGTQELVDLAAVLTSAASLAGIRDQILGNVDAFIAHRQVVPESAELLAAIAGTRGAWVTTHQTGGGFSAVRTGLGSRTRGREYAIHPDEIKSLGVGEAAVIVPRLRQATIARIIHPSRLRERRGRAHRA